MDLTKAAILTGGFKDLVYYSKIYPKLKFFIVKLLKFIKLKKLWYSRQEILPNLLQFSQVLSMLPKFRATTLYLNQHFLSWEMSPRTTFVKLMYSEKASKFYEISTAHWAFYYTVVHKKSKNLKNGHFLQSRTKIALIEIKFAKFWHIGGWCAPVCLIDTLKNLGFL